MAEFFAGPVGSWIRVWLATALTVFLADLTMKQDIDPIAYAIAGLVAILPPIIAYLNPADPRFGNTK
jgi:hypothetical protein